MTENTLILVAGVVLSLVFSYVPGARHWFDSLDKKHGEQVGGNYKRLVMLGLLALVALGAFGLGCLGRYDGVTCDVDGIWKLLEVFVLAAIGNQTAYTISPKIRR